MRPRSSMRTRVILMICALLCAAIPTLLILLGQVEPVRSFIKPVTAPIEAAFSSVGRSFSSLFAYFSDYDVLRAENEALKRELASMEETVRKAEEIRAENKFLSEFLELKENHADYRFIKCEVVARDDSGYKTTFTVNAGEDMGASVGDPVITSLGVVGRITEIGGNWATVTPLTETTSSIGAYSERSGDEGIVEGTLASRSKGTALFSYLAKDADLAVGDRIRTAGQGSYYPRGLLLGRITAITSDPATGAQSAEIAPAVDLSALYEVMILTDFAVAENESTEAPTEETDA